jgi:glycine cleavage system H protein
MASELKNFAGNLWYLKEDNIYTVGLAEEALDEFEEIESLDLPPEAEIVDPDASCGSIETDKGNIDLYSPVSGTISEINSAVVEDPSLIIDDPSDAWIFKVESDEEPEDDEEDDEDGDEDEDDQDEDEDEDFEDEDNEER